MPAIPIYSSSPINASKADCPSTQPEDPKHPPMALGAPVATPTPACRSRTRYPVAQPGASASPYTPQPTPTRTLGTFEGSPPLPQPGAFPTPPRSFSNKTTTLPPPPKSGEVMTAARTASSPRYPAQMAIPSPAAPFPAHQRGTSTTAATDPFLHSAPVPIDPTTSSLTHPPGYQQNTRVSEFSSYQHAANDALRQSGEFECEGEGEGGWWGTAKKLAAEAGEKLSAAESEVWRRINRD